MDIVGGVVDVVGALIFENTGVFVAAFWSGMCVYFCLIVIIMIEDLLAGLVINSN